MAKILNIDEMIQAAIDSDMPNWQGHVQSIEGAASVLSQALAAHLKIDCSEAKSEPGFGGTCAAFYPKTHDQPCPFVIDQGDVGGDWEMGQYIALKADKKG